MRHAASLTPKTDARNCPRSFWVPNPWFRMYSEIRQDPKVRTMPEAYQLRLIWLLTLRCEGPTEKLTEEELMFGLSCDATFLKQLHETFLVKNFIEKDWAIKNWMKRQYVSDCSTSRVRKFRANRSQKQDETFPKRCETQNETYQNRTEQNRTDTENAKTTPKAAPSAFVLPLWISDSTWKDFEEHRKKLRKPMTDRARRDIVSKLEKLRGKGQDVEEMLAQSIRKGWQDVFEVKEEMFAARQSQPKPMILSGPVEVAR